MRSKGAPPLLSRSVRRSPSPSPWHSVEVEEVEDAVDNTDETLLRKALPVNHETPPPPPPPPPMAVAAVVAEEVEAGRREARGEEQEEEEEQALVVDPRE